MEINIQRMLFLCSWLLLPLLLEIVPSLFSGIKLLILAHKDTKPRAVTRTLAKISIVVPVYNSAKTLQKCLTSIYNSNYQNELIEVFVVDNGSTDDTKDVFLDCRDKLHGLKMEYLHSSAGKSRALNVAMYHTSGKYIINVDSDGMFERSALVNIVDDFERNNNLQCISGVILINPRTIFKAKSIQDKVLHKLEMLEYCRTFLTGKRIDSFNGQIYTASGACTAFRRTILFSIGGYNTTTISEDTDITFAIRQQFPDGISLCADAYFFIESVESIDSLYVQRKRWQKGELEISYLYMRNSLKNPFKFVKDFRIRILLLDHTFALPRMIWLSMLICWLIVGYSLGLIATALLIMYCTYLLLGIWDYLVSLSFLSGLPNYKNRYKKIFPYVFLMPLYSIVILGMRISGFFMKTFSGKFWRGESFSEEISRIKKIISDDFTYITKLYRKIYYKINFK